MASPLLELACFDYDSAIIAAESGANRIEYCHDYSMGGKTPDLESTRNLLSKVNIPVFIMLRIGSGFHFQKNDIDVYKKNIADFKLLGVHGFVIGFLNDQNEIDVDFNQQLLDLVKPLPCTFHRAIDCTSNYHKSIQQVIDMGFDRILTSGGPGNAPEYIPRLTRAQEKFGHQIKIMPGGGIRSHNIKEIMETTLCKEFHTAAFIQNKINSNEIKDILAQMQ